MKRFLTGGTASVAKKVSGGGSAAASAGGDPVKLACWNVQSLCAERGPLALHMDAIADWVEEKIPDVLFLSEVLCVYVCVWYVCACVRACVRVCVQCTPSFLAKPHCFPSSRVQFFFFQSYGVYSFHPLFIHRTQVKLIAASDGMGGRKQGKQATPVDMPSTFSKARAKGAVAEHKMVQAAFDSDGCFADYKLRKLSLDPQKKNAGTSLVPSTKCVRVAVRCTRVRTCLRIKIQFSIFVVITFFASGTAMLTRKLGPQPTRVWTYLPDDLVAKVDMKRHNPDGRIILAE